jgi:hypothetical protein
VHHRSGRPTNSRRDGSARGVRPGSRTWSTSRSPRRRSSGTP